jgi:hypothetical protein
MAAVLDAAPGAAVCGPAGAALWGAGGYRVTPVDVVRSDAASGRRSTLARHHQLADLRRRHVTELRGIPVVRPEIVVLQLCGSAPRPRAAAVLDTFWRERLTSGLPCVACSPNWAGPDGTVWPSYVSSSTNVATTTSRRRAGSRGRFETILRQAGEPPMRRQVDTGGEHRVGRVDLRDDRLPLVVEVQSEKYHSALGDRQADERRLAALRAAGFAVSR